MGDRLTVPTMTNTVFIPLEWSGKPASVSTRRLALAICRAWLAGCMPVSESGSTATCRVWPVGCRPAWGWGLWIEAQAPAPVCKSQVSG